MRLLSLIPALLFAVEPDGSTPLLRASHEEDLAAVERLIRGGADVNAANDLGATPLWAACENGNVAIVRKLLDAGANPNLALHKGETPLMIAARAGKPEIAELLLTKGAQPGARGPRGQTALMWAAAQKHPEVVKVLLAHGADIQARSEVWKNVEAVPPHGHPEYNKLIPHGGDTALLFAARVGDLESAKLLVAAGAGVNDADAWGVSALTLAAHSDYRDVAEFLLEKGADPNRAPAGFTALHNAIMHRDEKLVEALLAHGANPNTPVQTWTPVRRSAKDYHFPPSLMGATPFWLAARFTQPGVMRLLVKHGADPKFVHRVSYLHDFNDPRSESANAVQAAFGQGGGVAWVQPPAAEREGLTLETVKLAVELGVPADAASLAAAKALRFDRVVQFLQTR
jgi:ankyrin repeat protein